MKKRLLAIALLTATSLSQAAPFKCESIGRDAFGLENRIVIYQAEPCSQGAVQKEMTDLFSYEGINLGNPGSQGYYSNRSVYVRGYTRSNGTRVNSYTRSAPHHR